MAAGNGCNTNSNSGIRPDEDADGLISLNFANRQTMVELSNLYVRWQGPQVSMHCAPPYNTVAHTAARVGGCPRRVFSCPIDTSKANTSLVSFPSQP